MVQVDDARRDEAAESDAEVDEHEVETEGPLAVLGGTMRESSVLLGPQPAPPKSASSSAATAAWVSECACAQRISDAASATTAIMMTRTGPKRSVSEPHNGLLQMPTSAAAESRSVAKSVEKPRTLCR